MRTTASILLTIVLGAASESSRAIESQKLLNFGFQNFDAVRVFAKDQTAATYEVWKGSVPEVKAGVGEDLIVTIPQGQAPSVKAEIERIKPLVAPVAQGQRVGTLRVKLGDKLLAERPVIALAAIPEAGFFGRAWDTVRLWFDK